MAQSRQPFSFNLSPEVVSAAERAAFEQGVTLTELIERLLREEAEHCGHLAAVPDMDEHHPRSMERPDFSFPRMNIDDCEAAPANGAQEQDVRSSPLYGFDLSGGSLVPNEQEQAVIRWMKMRYLLIGSFSGVARELNERGTPSKRGGQWRPSTVREIMLRTD